MDPSKYEYQSDFARRYFAEGQQIGEARGREIGEARGRTVLLLRLLTLKFGELSEAHRQRVLTASVEELDAYAERILLASDIAQVFA